MKTCITEQFWTDPEIEELGPDEKLALLWVMSNPNCNLCGFTKYSNRRFEFETGLSASSLERACQGLIKGFTTPSKGFVWSRNFVAYQFGRGPALARKNMAKSIVKNLEKMPSELQEIFLKEYPELRELSKPLPSPPQGEREGEGEREVENRKRNKKGEWTPDENQKQINSWFRRKDSTRWSEKELRSYQKLSIDATDLELLSRYYLATDIPEDKNIRRRDIVTLLNNWPGEVDRARAYCDKQEKAASTIF